MNIEIPVFVAPAPANEVTWEKKDWKQWTALIDADFLKYYITSAIYKRVMDEGQDHTQMMLEFETAKYVNREIFNKFDTKATIFCFSAPSKHVFRQHIAQEKKYKGNRENSKDYTYYDQKYDDMQYIVKWVSEHYPTLFYDDLEADDLVTMLQDQSTTFIYSYDKDLKQVPGFHYNMDFHRLDFIDEETATKTLLNQIMRGDSTDNIPGIKGFGEVSQLNFVKEHGHLTAEEYAHVVLRKFTDTFGVRIGLDVFNEMWGLVRTRLDRGDYFRQRYKRAFALIESL